MYNRETHAITLQVLYDNILSKRIGTCTLQDIGKHPTTTPLTFADINGRALSMPAGTWPFRRAIAWVSRTAFANAMASPSPQACAMDANISEEQWNETFISVRSQSQIKDSSVFARLDYEYDDDNS